MTLIHISFNGQVISKNLQPPQSRDLNPPDLFLRGHLCEQVLCNKPCTTDALKGNITNETRKTDRKTIRCATNMQRPIYMCLVEDGGHFQHTCYQTVQQGTGMCPISIIRLSSFVYDLKLNIWVLCYTNHRVLFGSCHSTTVWCAVDQQSQYSFSILGLLYFRT
jgi:hypothetical protein